MRWTADCLVAAGRFGPGGTLVCDATGRIERIDWEAPPPAATSAADRHGARPWPPQTVLLPALAEPLPLDALEDAFGGGPRQAPGGAELALRLAPLRDTLRNVSAAELQRGVAHALRRLARQGVGLVGIPAHAAFVGSRVRPEMLDAIAHAAQAVGTRVALLLPFEAPHPDQHLRASELEDYCSSVDQAVRHVQRLRDPKLSWALWAPSPRQLTPSVIIALRLRLAHLPLLLTDDAPAVDGRPARDAGGARDTNDDAPASGPLAMLARSHCLDAGIAHLSIAPLAAPARKLLDDAGALSLRIARARWPAALLGRAGDADDELCRGWASPALDVDTVRAQIARSDDAHRALGLRRTRLLSGGWADAVVRPWQVPPDGPSQASPSASAPLGELVIGGSAVGPVLVHR